MIKAVVDRFGRVPLVIVGLSRRNIEILMRGNPILVEGGELGINADIVIHFGETEDDMREELFGMLGNPLVDVDRRRG